MVQLDYPETGSIIEASDHIDRMGFMLSNQLSLFLDGATSTNQENLKLDLFSSDTAQYLEFMEYNSGTDLYECMDTSTTYYIIIEATSTIATTTGNVNVAEIASGKWIIFATAGTYEVNRAEVMEYLFRPSNTSDATTANIKSDFTTVTAIKSNESRDIGRRAIWLTLTDTVNGDGCYIDPTFDDAVTNGDVSSWSRCASSGGTGAGTWFIASGVQRNTFTGASGSSDEFGDNLSGDEVPNPADCKYFAKKNGGFTGSVQVLILSKSGVSDFTIHNSGGSVGSSYEYDFDTDGSIVDITATTESDLTCRITTDSTTITTSEQLAFVKAVYTLTAGNTLAYEVSFDDGSNWQTVTESTLSKITATGTAFRVRMTITRATNTETDSITSYGAYYS